MAVRGIEVTTASEYVPRWVELWPAFDTRPVRMLNGEAPVEQAERSPVSWSGRIQAKDAGTAEMPIGWFPGWEVRVDGAAVATEPAKSTGLIHFALPAGEHTIEARLTRTAPRLVGDWLSLLSLAALVIAAIPRRKPAEPPPAAKTEPKPHAKAKRR